MVAEPDLALQLLVPDTFSADTFSAFRSFTRLPISLVETTFLQGVPVWSSQGESYMKCAKHPVEDAVGTCASCNRGICSPCSQRFNVIKCEDCILRENTEIKKRLKRDIFLPAAIGILSSLVICIYIAYTTLSNFSPSGIFATFEAFLILAAIITFTPFGWRMINTFIYKLRGESGGSTFLFGDPSGAFVMIMLAYLFYLFKAFVSVAVGVVGGPYIVWRDLKRIKEIDRTEASIRQGLI